MKKIPFSIEHRADIDAGKCQLLTGDEMPVTVQDWDFIPGCRITAKIPNINGYDFTLIYDYNGKTVAKYRNRWTGILYDLRLFVSYK